MRRLAILAAAALAVAGCSDKAPPPETNDAAVAPEPAPPPPPPPRVEPPKPKPPVETNDSAADEPVDDSAQTQEDADAVGMTTRAPLPNVEDEDLPANAADSGAGDR